jgi:hypothetical protein
MLEAGAEALKNAALHHHPQEQELEESRSGRCFFSNLEKLDK